MALQIPKSVQYTIKRGHTGVPVFAVQRLCNRLGYPTSEDMNFGAATEASVKKMQARIGVVADGVVGPGTQRKLAEYLCAKEEIKNGLVRDLLLSKVLYESGGNLAAVNWMSPGGVDCGITQRRVYDEQFSDDATVKRAFDAVYQVGLSGDRVTELYSIFLPRAGVKGNKELALRLAVLNHNYPTLADRISRDGISGLSSYYTSPQTWVTTYGLTFPSGAHIRTPLEWGQRYALGNKTHNEPGQATKLVRTWPA